jgi:hypothetical protein
MMIVYIFQQTNQSSIKVINSPEAGISYVIKARGCEGTDILFLLYQMTTQRGEREREG